MSGPELGRVEVLGRKSSTPCGDAIILSESRRSEVKGQKFGQQRHEGAILAHEPDKPDALDFVQYPVEVSMTGTFVPLRRIVALFVVVTLFAAPIASAQSPEAAPPTAAPPNTALLSNAAFARLIQPPPTVARTRIVQDPPRLDLRRRVTAPAARRGPAAFAMAPQQKSWVARHKVATGVLIGVGVVLAGWIIAVHNSGCGQDNSCFD
jgi:hypothetical protein